MDAHLLSPKNLELLLYPNRGALARSKFQVSTRLGYKSLKTLVLLSKKVARTTDFRPDISLFEIENRFVIGYGLDYKEYYRGLPSIYFLKEIV